MDLALHMEFQSESGKCKGKHTCTTEGHRRRVAQCIHCTPIPQEFLPGNGGNCL